MSKGKGAVRKVMALGSTALNSLNCSARSSRTWPSPGGSGRGAQLVLPSSVCLGKCKQRTSCVPEAPVMSSRKPGQPPFPALPFFLSLAPMSPELSASSSGLRVRCTR